MFDYFNGTPQGGFDKAKARDARKRSILGPTIAANERSSINGGRRPIQREPQTLHEEVVRDADLAVDEFVKAFERASHRSRPDGLSADPVGDARRWAQERENRSRSVDLPDEPLSRYERTV